jgi:hypothetical protein
MRRTALCRDSTDSTTSARERSASIMRFTLRSSSVLLPLTSAASCWSRWRTPSRRRSASLQKPWFRCLPVPGWYAGPQETTPAPQIVSGNTAKKAKDTHKHEGCIHGVGQRASPLSRVVHQQIHALPALAHARLLQVDPVCWQLQGPMAVRLSRRFTTKPPDHLQINGLCHYGTGTAGQIKLICLAAWPRSPLAMAPRLIMDLPGPAINCIIQEYLGAKDKLALFKVPRRPAHIVRCCMCTVLLRCMQYCAVQVSHSARKVLLSHAKQILFSIPAVQS